MNTIQRIYRYMRRNPDLELFKATKGKTHENVGWNIYYPNAQRKELRKRYRLLHRWWKYAIIAPIILATKGLFGKYLKEPIKIKGDHWDKTNLDIIDKSLEETYRIWYKEFYVNVGKDQRQFPTKKQVDKAMKEFYAIDFMRTMHRALLKYGAMDSAYKPILDIFPHVLTKNMIKAYEGKKPMHVLYTSREINDPMYYMAIEVLGNKNGVINTLNDIKEDENVIQEKRAKGNKRIPNKSAANPNAKGRGTGYIYTTKWHGSDSDPRVRIEACGSSEPRPQVSSYKFGFKDKCNKSRRQNNSRSGGQKCK